MLSHSLSHDIEETDYVHNSFRIAVGLSKESQNLLPSVPLSLQRLFTRIEENESMERDQWDNWEYGYSNNYKQGQLWVPECDIWIREQRARLSKEGEKLFPVWPKGHDFAVCLTHDVDIIGETMTLGQRGREFLRNARAHDLSSEKKLLGLIKSIAKMVLKKSSLCPRTTNTLEISYLIEKKLNVTASYFFTMLPSSHMSKYDCLYDTQDRCRFLGKSYRINEVMAFLFQEGFDVGLHGSYFSALEDGLLIDQKTQLEKAIQGQVYTTRQHWLHLHLPLTFNLQEQAGFLADTTLGFNRNIGFRAGTSFPFFAYDRKRKQQLSLIEAPLIIQDGGLLKAYALEYTPNKALEVVKEFVSRIKETSGCLTFLFHPDIFMKEENATLYRSIIEYCLSQNAWVTDLNAIQTWWRQRSEKIS